MLGENTLATLEATIVGHLKFLAPTISVTSTASPTEFEAYEAFHFELDSFEIDLRTCQKMVERILENLAPNTVLCIHFECDDNGCGSLIYGSKHTATPDQDVESVCT